MGFQLASALDEMHTGHGNYKGISNGYAHGDISEGNVMIKRDVHGLQFVLIDFGCVSPFYPFSPAALGNAEWLQVPPEVARPHSDTPHCVYQQDMWCVA